MWTLYLSTSTQACCASNVYNQYNLPVARNQFLIRNWTRIQYQFCVNKLRYEQTLRLCLLLGPFIADFVMDTLAEAKPTPYTTGC